MLKNIKKRLKDQRGVTLVELLAVIVILGIISAIAVPNIGRIIDNTKADAHIANAQQVGNAAKLYITSKKNSTGETVTLKTLIDEGYIEPLTDPSANDNKGYDQEASKVEVTKTSNQFTYTVTLLAYKEGTGGGDSRYTGNPFAIATQ
jgi:type IV pilus assembly protein PilA